jgi:hypothetical protein
MKRWQDGKNLDQVVNEAIAEALDFYGGNKTRTAKALAISIRTLRNRVARDPAMLRFKLDRQKAALHECIGCRWCEVKK